GGGGAGGDFHAAFGGGIHFPGRGVFGAVVFVEIVAVVEGDDGVGGGEGLEKEAAFAVGDDPVVAFFFGDFLGLEEDGFFERGVGGFDAVEEDEGAGTEVDDLAGDGFGFGGVGLGEVAGGVQVAAALVECGEAGDVHGLFDSLPEADI